MSAKVETAATLDLPKQLDKATAQELKDPIRKWLNGKTKEFWGVMPWINYILDGFNPETGLYPEPPTLKDGYLGITAVHRDNYSDMSRRIYDIVAAQLGGKMAVIRAEFSCGIHDRNKACTMIGDGVMAIYCIMSKWGRVQANEMQLIEEKFTTAAHHFETGDPSKKVEYLRPYLEEAHRLGVQMKAYQTLVPIAEAVANRHITLAVPMAKFIDGSFALVEARR